MNKIKMLNKMSGDVKVITIHQSITLLYADESMNRE
jgi:hypothetical protein